MLQDAYSAPVDSDVVIDPNEVRPWSIETRIKDHREMRAEKEKHETQKKSNMDKLMAGVSSPAVHLSLARPSSVLPYSVLVRDPSSGAQLIADTCSASNNSVVARSNSSNTGGECFLWRDSRRDFPAPRCVCVCGVPLAACCAVC